MYKIQKTFFLVSRLFYEQATSVACQLQQANAVIHVFRLTMALDLA